MQGVPVKYKQGMFMVEKIQMAGVAFASRHKNTYVATQNVETVLRWIQEYKKWNPNETN
jgi:hypothetical protein